MCACETVPNVTNGDVPIHSETFVVHLYIKKGPILRTFWQMYVPTYLYTYVYMYACMNVLCLHLITLNFASSTF